MSGTSIVYRTARGELTLSWAAPSVLVFEYEGYADGSFIDFIDRVWNDCFPDGSFPVQVFVDTERQTGAASEFRTKLMAWARRVLPRTDVYCLLVKSRWVAMGISIVRATMGLSAAHVEVTTSREVFGAKLADAIRRSTMCASA